MLWVERVKSFQHVDSAAIAARLEAEGATCCEHRKNPCTDQCGVRCTVKRLPDTVARDGDTVQITANYKKWGPWQVIPFEERLAWAERVDAIRARDAARSP